MSAPNTFTRSSASESSWYGESAHNSTMRSQHMLARTGMPLNEYGLPLCSYRYHMLQLEDLEIQKSISKIGQDFEDGILDFNQWRVLVRHWRDKERAIAEQMDEEMETGPQSLNEVLQSWGYTDEQATLIFRQNLDMRLENRSRSKRHLYGRNVRGD
ncbi:hypothetical protein EVG20_g5764 [Dentipellis fragilis]|uniref:Uncharacterized protein n=1 Tax=Dentipellis fragilis TaxID=205917 RepID=A0A4Y9YTE5_9AGAM|nr:hypothetical protein EVG20_g5764 [Dentipellis fragilis]